MVRIGLTDWLVQRPSGPGHSHVASVFADVASSGAAGTGIADDAQEATPAADAPAEDKLEAPSTGQEELPEHHGVGIEDARAIHAQRKGKVRSFKEYHLMVDTGTSPQSLTHGDIYVQLIGNRGKTGLIHLAKGLSAASRAEYSVFASDVGRVERMRLAADTTDRWFCDRVWLVSPEGTREFPVGQYIGWPNNPETTVSPLYASLGPAGVLLGLAVSSKLAAPQLRSTGRRSPSSRAPWTSSYALQRHPQTGGAFL
eukprot:TRINITY_DN80572_c0_g1_i1.p1 TRINITY_DN80572_c0_g1~~TRINITY_DN80572_c0_g1_i1.p1  ORF type:complete len:281 (-),score=23.39 TRINITY_DN80572_c0_g1_i1:20-787(-)